MSANLFPARFQSAAAFIKTGLHCDDAELTVFDFTMRGHHPDKIDRMAGHGDVRVKAARHQHSIAIAHDADKFRLVRVCIDKLDAEGWRGHIVIDVKLFENRRVLVRWPTR